MGKLKAAQSLDSMLEDAAEQGNGPKSRRAARVRSIPVRPAAVDLPKHVLHAGPDGAIGRWLNKVHCGDCLALMNEMPPCSVGAIVTSPPYNLRNSTGNGMKDGRGGKWANARLLDGYDGHDDAMSHGEYVAWQRECLTAMIRVLREDGAIFYNHKWRVQAGLLQDRSDIVQGFPVRQIVIWKRSGGINFNSGYFLPTYEVIYLICKPAFRLAPKANAMGDVWEIPQEVNNAHPAPFPAELARRCIKSTTAQIVLDPFLGSGTTAIAAEACQRDWIGIELAVDYCKLATQRIERARKPPGCATRAGGSRRGGMDRRRNRSGA